MQAEHPVFTAECLRVRLQGGRRRSQNYGSVLHLRPFHRHIPRMVPGHYLALIGAFMLFVYDNQSQPGKRSKQCRARTNHNIDIAASGPLKLIVPFPRRQAGIDYGNPVSEPAVETHDRLVGKRDLGDQDDNLHSLTYDSGNHLHIDLGLAASGNAVDQIRLPFSRFIIFTECVCSRLLFPV